MMMRAYPVIWRVEIRTVGKGHGSLAERCWAMCTLEQGWVGPVSFAVTPFMLLEAKRLGAKCRQMREAGRTVYSMVLPQMPVITIRFDAEVVKLMRSIQQQQQG